jgi:hypothetical protein
MRSDWQTAWRIGKFLLGLAIIGGVGWRFYTILRRPELWEKPIPARVEWLEATAIFYVLGLLCPALFWNWLMASLGERPSLRATVRAYFIGQSGKYVPGKAWGLLLRTGMVAAAGVRPAVGALTTVFETLTTMSAGALLAAVLFLFLALNETAAWWALGLLAIAGLPVLPVVFNPMMKVFGAMADKAARRVGSVGVAPLPQVRLPTLLAGLGITACGWLVLGLSLWAMLQALLPEPPGWYLDLWGRCTAFVALAWVAGFLAVPAPGGLGVRELFLERLLVPEIRTAAPGIDAEGMAVVVALVLRLLWTAAEVIMVGVVYWLPVTALPASEAPPPDSGTAP